MAAARPPPSPDTPPDLSRLRIPRAGSGMRPYRGIPWLGLLLLVGLVGVGWLFRARLLGLARGVRAPEVGTAKALRVVPGRGGEGDVSANGYVFANRQASVATVLSGRLVELNAEEGDVVPADAVMARIQFEDYEAAWKATVERVEVARARVEEARRAVDEAQAELPRFEAVFEALRRERALAAENLDRLKREVVRNQPLRDRNVIDEGTWDRIQVEAQAARETLAASEARVAAASAAVEAGRARVRRFEASLPVAESSVAAARQDAEVARVTLEKTIIRAPFEGLVIRKDAELGEVIAPTGAGNSRGSVFTIVDPTSLEVQVELSEKRIRRVEEGDIASIFLDADPDTAWPGRVRKIWPRADRSKGTIELRVTFDERPDDVRPEMAARVVFLGKQEPVEVEAPYVTVPAAAVLRRGGRDVVFVLEGEFARLVAVDLEEGTGDPRRVAAGLEGGEIVILAPTPSLVDGARVRQGEGR